MKKKLVAIFLILAMIASLVVACGGGGASSDGGGDAASTDGGGDAEVKQAFPSDTAASDCENASGKTYEIAVVGKDLSGEWFKRMEVGVNQFAADYNVHSYETGPASYDPALQLTVVENLIAQHVDAIVIVPIDPATVEPALKRAMDEGIVVITHEAPDVVNSYYNVECGPLDEYAKGIMDALAQGMGGEGTWVGVVGSLTVPTHMTWVDIADEYAKEKYPNLVHSDVDRIESKDTKETSYEACKELLKAHPEITGILCVSDMDNLGAAQAIKELGLEGKVVTAGGGIPSTHRDALNNGEVLSAGLWDPAETGYAACAIALRILEDGIDKAGDIPNPFNAGIGGYEEMYLEGKTYFGHGTIVWTADPEQAKEYPYRDVNGELANW